MTRLLYDIQSIVSVVNEIVDCIVPIGGNLGPQADPLELPDMVDRLCACTHNYYVYTDENDYSDMLLNKNTTLDGLICVLEEVTENMTTNSTIQAILDMVRRITMLHNKKEQEQWTHC